MYSAIILQDIARPHKAECVRQLLRRLGWEELEHPPYSPDISPCDFDLIPKIKELIRGRWLTTRENIGNAVELTIADDSPNLFWERKWKMLIILAICEANTLGFIFTERITKQDSRGDPADETTDLGLDIEILVDL
ncbi:histone-lysine N-methyltransferase SETMAR [Trichonephila clavipes]|uniref:Histone-lysine N-methyltransferase SETMAR n=1 Tax=Trichonephila clavipes TaxID=2585209 RepID=A0A8X6VXP0_TRICX|nr:histone-lysine N-methyltransferase SETMAR [Trichonephila clavipes]